MSNYYFYFKETNIEFVDELLDKITAIADQNAVKFMGGGFGRIVMLGEEYGYYDIPDEAVEVIMKIVKDENSSDIRGYFIDINNIEFSPEKLEKIKKELKAL